MYKCVDTWQSWPRLLLGCVRFSPPFLPHRDGLQNPTFFPGCRNWAVGGSQSGQELVALYFLPGLNSQHILPLGFLLGDPSWDPGFATKAVVSAMLTRASDPASLPPATMSSLCHCPDHLFVCPCDRFLLSPSSHPLSAQFRSFVGGYPPHLFALRQSSKSPRAVLVCLLFWPLFFVPQNKERQQTVSGPDP